MLILEARREVPGISPSLRSSKHLYVGHDVSVQFSAVYPSTTQITGHITILTDSPSHYKQFKTVSSQNFLRSGISHDQFSYDLER